MFNQAKKQKEKKKKGKKLHNTLQKRRNCFTHKCNTVREGASESLQLEAYNSAKRASQGLSLILKMKLAVLEKTLLILAMDIYKTASRRKLNKQHTSTLLENAVNFNFTSEKNFRRSYLKEAVWWVSGRWGM